MLALRPDTVEPEGFPGEKLWLVVILAVGFLVRVWGLDFGLPFPEARPDESTIIRHALAFFSGDPNPHFFNYPSLYLYLLFALYLGYFLIGKGFGFFSSPDDLIAQFVHDPYNIYLIDRALSVLFGTATILAVYYLARRLWGRRTALVAALFMALAYLHARDSHFGTTDVAMVFLALTSLIFMVRARQEGGLGSYVLAGVLAGLAASTKYNAVLLILPMAAVHLFNALEAARGSGPGRRPQGRIFSLARRYLLLVGGLGLLVIGLFWATQAALMISPDHHIENHSAVTELRLALILGGLILTATGLAIGRFRLLAELLDRRIILFGAALGAAFLAATPYALLDCRTFLTDFLFEMYHLRVGHGLDLGRGFFHHAVFTLPLGLGWAPFGAFLAGLPVLAVRSPKTAAILLSFPLAYYLSTGQGLTVFVRYMLPVVPFACLSAAYLVSGLGRSLARRLGGRIREGAVIALPALLILLQPACDIARFDLLLARTDNRLLALDWLEKNLEKGATVFQVGAVEWCDIQLLRLPHYYDQVIPIYLARGGQGYLSILGRELESLKSRTVWADPGFRSLEGGAGFSFGPGRERGLPDYIIDLEYPLVLYHHKPQAVADLLKESYTPIKRFRALDPDARGNRFDQMDAFYLPFSGFKGVHRPGPNITIHRRTKPG